MTHLSNSLKKTNEKLQVFTILQKNMTSNEKALSTSLFSKYLLNYCPLIWIFCPKLLWLNILEILPSQGPNEWGSLVSEDWLFFPFPAFAKHGQICSQSLIPHRSDSENVAYHKKQPLKTILMIRMANHPPHPIPYYRPPHTLLLVNIFYQPVSTDSVIVI